MNTNRTRRKQTPEQRHALAQLLVAQAWWLRHRSSETRAVMQFAARRAYELDALRVWDVQDPF